MWQQRQRKEWWVCKAGTPRIADKCQKLEGVSSTGCRGRTLTTALDSRTVRQWMPVVLSHPVCGTLWQPSQTNIPHPQANSASWLLSHKVQAGSHLFYAFLMPTLPGSWHYSLSSSLPHPRSDPWSMAATTLGCRKIFQKKMSRRWTYLGTVRIKPKAHQL